MRPKPVTEYIVDWLQDYLRKSGARGFVVGISGGIDSAVTASLVARTGFPLLCVELPIHQHPDEVNRGHAHIIEMSHQYLNVSHTCFDLSAVFDLFSSSVPDGFATDTRDMPLANARARMRMTALYYLSAVNHALVVGTGNKVEDFGVGFFTKYGDGGVDISPIAGLNKTQVYALGKYLGVNERILTAEPTDGLWSDNRSDEDQLGASYEELEWAMRWTSNTNRDNSKMTKRQREVCSIYQKLNAANRHKMQPIPVCPIPEELLNEE